MEDITVVMEKVRKLLKLANNNPNINEAASAMAKAQELITRFKIEGLNLEEPSAVSSKPLIEILYAKQNVSGWRGRLAQGIGKCNNCEIIWVQTRSAVNHRALNSLSIVGTKENIEISRYLFVYCEREIERLCFEAMKIEGLGSGKDWANSFKLGAASAVGNKMAQEQEKVKVEYQGSMALVRLNQEALVTKDFFNKVFTNQRATSLTNSRADANSLGYERGKGISWNKSLNGGSQNNFKRLN